jgi:hypothetical protein
MIEATIDEVSGKEIIFHVTNDSQCSSILDLEKCKNYYPHIVVIENRKQISKTIKDIYEENKLSGLNFWNLDIQGAELKALKGAGDILKDVDAIYTEVNIEEIYKGCCMMPELDKYLQTFGFTRKMTSMTSKGWGDALYTK